MRNRNDPLQILLCVERVTLGRFPMVISSSVLKGDMIHSSSRLESDAEIREALSALPPQQWVAQQIALLSEQNPDKYESGSVTIIVPTYQRLLWARNHIALCDAIKDEHHLVVSRRADTVCIRPLASRWIKKRPRPTKTVGQAWRELVDAMHAKPELWVARKLPREIAKKSFRPFVMELDIPDWLRPSWLAHAKHVSSRIIRDYCLPNVCYPSMVVVYPGPQY